ncbi:RNA 2',3'-cyclic phosphodiesterase [Rufibacter tibetensis]|uniref:RNA 2',3'-cyclic phosphodiesterase n=1 Tax=Rufibacter tibetensis TaxID=512763 RepID=A0A0P0CA53_9BACT|nr:RNA 2',3'-cyclic phosphodiesterase [Rufibacter tibetensis]ALJ00509.1 2'-5' RNA ligase [Rufibacter tibetensis]
MKDTNRLFIAAKLPDEVITYLVQARQAYDDPAIRAVPEQNLHLTLYFLGNVPAIEDTFIRQTLAQVAQRHSPFNLTLEQLEPGPKPRSPRLIWARFTLNETFSNLSQELTQALSSAPPKQEKFIPHVTLCRFKKEGVVPRDLPIISPPEDIVYPVSSIALWQSQLASPHPVYIVLEEYPLFG